MRLSVIKFIPSQVFSLSVRYHLLLFPLQSQFLCER
ncbi:unnamed protein product [Brugia timori]|uniref:Uncharacterized protein n=1 Tax=Brugia timori TaxID=42155 RepID=A0A0R3QEM3_9BILA|nr:unnamed protein product [Brugia timori]